MELLFRYLPKNINYYYSFSVTAQYLRNDEAMGIVFPKSLTFLGTTRITGFIETNKKKKKRKKHLTYEKCVKYQNS